MTENKNLQYEIRTTATCASMRMHMYKIEKKSIHRDTSNHNEIMYEN